MDQTDPLPQANDTHLRSRVGPTRPADGPAVQIRIDGGHFTAHVGEPLVDVINRAQIELTQVCYHPQLGPLQTCDTCVVEIDGQLGRACGTRVTEGLTVRTQTQAARTAQRDAYDRLAANHSLYCTVCDNNNGNCTMHNALHTLHFDHQERPFQSKGFEKDFSNPFYRYDPDQCILCGRCVEACQNVQVNETLSINWEAEQPRVLWDGGKPIGESSCVSCGHCVTVCPCNALMETTMLGEAGLMTGLPLPVFNAAVDVVKSVEPATGLKLITNVSEAESAARERYIKKTKTVCTYCGVGCSFEVWTKDRHILKVEPGQGPANGISTCVKGKFGWDYVNSGERLTSPLIREGERFREASWDEALALVARRLTEIKEGYGPDALAMIASSKCTNEEAFLVQKMARQVIGTNNVDNCSRYCQSPATMGLFRTVGHGGDSGTIYDLEQSDMIIGIGTNTAESHPVIATRIKRAQKLRGAKLVVFDIREHEMARRADTFLRPHPGTDFVWLTAMSKYILDQGLADHDFLRERVNGLDEYRASIESYTMAYAAEETGIAQDALEKLAREIAASPGVSVCWAMGVTQQCGGSETSTAIANLLLVTGNFGKTGCGVYPLRGHNNVQGASDMGAMPDRVTGYQKVDDPLAAERYRREWGVTLRPERGLDNTQMVEAAARGTLKALWLTGEEMSLTDSDSNHVEASYGNLEFFVVQDLYFTNTARYADVILPGSPSLEKEGTFTNTERRIQRLYQVMPPLRGTKPDWEIYQAVAQRMGADWNYAHPSDIMDEIARLTPSFAGVSYERLEGFGSLCWPVAEDGTDTPLLYRDRFHFPDGKARLYPAEYQPRVKAPNAEYDLHLNSGRMLEHFHEGNMTFRIPGVAGKSPDAFVELSPELAAERRVTDGQYVRLVSESGAIRLRAVVTGRVSGNEVFVPMNSRDAADAVNRLTGQNKDTLTNTPAYKDTRVRMEVLSDSGPHPLPRTNHRWGHPTPQRGVEVERKWQRPDYVFPGGELPLSGASLNARTDRVGNSADD
ncbi:formate dehydrogenase subunit alpha [Deinococcus wulumuqiensis]|uniref:Formate dehydrogenase subunit alpha n=1 Tax=Deinococcus wulumuqiensis TaxID=980427 RepID=A0A345IFJ3_9DEIO|nr:formate dehydrogenase subunit alpha [Deinococcus wulumuqiensis]AXG98465.1 formate dehydrogenase subunit alpha [Deinococcus wulumuqiensis]